jgi:type I restriction enzyme S subunit
MGLDQTRAYDRASSVVFLKTDEPFGGLSNMAAGYPLYVQGGRFLTVEALYQACRFPHLPDVQRLIAGQKSPVTAKMRSKPYRKESRPDWDKVRVKVMRWCLRVKLAQNWATFGELLLRTTNHPIVEESRKDDFWGAKPVDARTLVGMNVLGRLLMELREGIKSGGQAAFLRVEPPEVCGFMLFGQLIEAITGRGVVATKAVAAPETQAALSGLSAPVSRQVSLFDRPATGGAGPPLRAPVQSHSALWDNLRPYPVMKDSGVPWLGEVPEHWEHRRLSHSVVGCINGVWGSEPNGREDVPCVRVADFDRWRLRVRLAQPTMRAIAPSERRRRMLARGDLLLEKSGGGDLQPVGVVALYDHDVPAVCSNFVARMPVAAGHDSGYLTYLHACLYSIRLNVRSIKQTTGIQNLDSSAYLSEPAAFPPLTEQAAIVRFLDHADRRIRCYIRAKQKLIKLLEEQKQAIIHRAVTRGLDPDVRLKPSYVEWLGDVPAHWAVVRSKRTFTPRTELARPNDIQLSATQAYGVIPQDEYERRVGRRIVKIFRHLEKRRHVEVGDFVISMRSFQGGLERAWTTGCIRSSYVVLRSVMHSDVGYYGYLFKSAGYIRALQSTADFIRDGQDLNFDNFCAVDLPFPPIEEQRQIATTLEAALSDTAKIAERAKKEIDLLKEWRTRLIADVVTGKLDVREAAAMLPEEPDKPGLLDDTEAPGEPDEETADNSDEIPAETEA